ncbi:MAG: winged helix-turn-helix transcriptional regulator [Candidatus Bathyarchaeota archaeon]|nr:winged helix-turn-helix transcriptional regulator [Candidatus Bathyarchaeota archaeon]
MIRLNQKTAFALLLALLACSVCFTAAASSPTAFPLPGAEHPGQLQLSASIPLIVGAGLQGNTSNPLEQPTRSQIYCYILQNPGVHFRGITGGLGLSVGVVQYHLYVLEHAGLVCSITDGQSKRYFERATYKETDVQLVSLMRHSTVAQILHILAQNGPTLHRDIADSLGVTSQALTYQMNQLKEAGLVTAEKVGVNVRYSLASDGMGRAILDLCGQLKI